MLYFNCHQRHSNFIPKLHENRWRLGLHPRSRWGAHDAPQTFNCLGRKQAPPQTPPLGAYVA
jgi:hypothetical protein